MANKGIAAFKEFTAGVLAKITDPDQRRRAEESFQALEQLDPVAQALGDGVAGQSEIDRQLQTLTQQREELETRTTELDERDTRLNTWHTELTGWYSDNKALVEDAKRLRAGGRANGNPNPDPRHPTPTPHPVASPGGLTEEQYNERIADVQAGFLGYQRDQNLITREHFTRFGEIVDVEPLLRHPQIGQVGLIGVYELVHKDRLDKWKTDTAESERKKISDEAVRKYQESQASMPYPSPTGAGSGSPLDALTVNKQDSVVDAATVEYNRLVNERAAGTPAR